MYQLKFMVEIVNGKERTGNGFLLNKMNWTEKELGVLLSDGNSCIIINKSVSL